MHAIVAPADGSGRDARLTRPRVPTGIERTFGEDEIIVSKTDLQGRITYTNAVFARVAGYTESELIGAPHSIIRHPEMPRCIFELLWTTLRAKREFFGYVNNLAKNGDHYWVLAHVTPTFDGRGEVTGYHSNRRVPHAEAVAQARALYSALLGEERRHSSRSEGLAASARMLTELLAARDQSYDEWVWGITNVQSA